MSIDAIKIPGVVLVAAMVAALIGVLGWTDYKLERKADKADITFIMEELKDIKTDLKILIRSH